MQHFKKELQDKSNFLILAIFQTLINNFRTPGSKGLYGCPPILKKGTTHVPCLQ